MKNSQLRSVPGLLLAISMIAFITLGCMGMRKPWRDYSPQPYSAAEWKSGDAIERGRMIRDMHCNKSKKCKADVSDREVALNSLGEPDFKKTIENREVWFYRIDLGISGAMDVYPVSFDADGKGFMGLVRGGTISLSAKEADL